MGVNGGGLYVVVNVLGYDFCFFFVGFCEDNIKFFIVVVCSEISGLMDVFIDVSGNFF